MLYIPDDDKLADEENEINEIEDTEDFVIEDCSLKMDDISDDKSDPAGEEADEDYSSYVQKTDVDIITGDSSDYDMDDVSCDIQDMEEVDFLDEEPGLEDEEITGRQKKKKSFVKGLVYDLIFYAVLTFTCIYIIPNFVLQRTIVDGSSMEDTLRDREQLYVEKISYHFNALKRFDIIVFYPYGRENEDYYVKRIIGLPGEKVQIIDGNIYINDELLEENYGKESIKDPGRAANPIYLAEDEYFVLGDNRNRSKDSRSEQVGNVKKENIGGRVLIRIYPFNRFGFVD